MKASLPQRPRIAVIGAGAVGAYYGAMLANSGQDVHFLMRADYEAVRAQGLMVRSYKGDFRLPAEQLHVYTRPEQMPRADLVMIALKATSNHLFKELITPLLTEDTALLTMQNGLGNEEALAELFGTERVLGGIAFVCNHRESPGVICHTGAGWVRLGELSGPPIQRTRQICQMFLEGGVECAVIDNLMHGRWEKIFWNIPFNGLGTIMGLTTDRLLATAEGVKLVRQLMEEGLSIARRLNLHWPEDFIEKKIAMTRKMGAYKTSMHIDRENGRPLEIEAIVGRPLRVAGELGVKVPNVEMLHRLLLLLED
jgi:2-dehydropantoate 2-reductase